MQLTDDMLQWIGLHNGEDTSRLRLRYSSDPTARFCIMQIECRRHAARKLPDTLQCRRFQFPTGLSAEQCTSDGIAEFHASLISPGETVLDMTAGLGIDAFHMARKGAQVTAIDINPDIAESLSHNAEVLGLSVETLCADCVSYLNQNDRHFDVIFIDPARRGDNGRRLFALSDCMPDVVSLMPLLRQRCGRLIIKASPMIDIHRTLQEVPCATHIYTTGTRSECKEIVAVCDFSLYNTGHEPAITAATMLPDEVQEFNFTIGEEQQCTASYEDPQAGHILYEPYPSVMKSGAYKLLCSRFRCAKLHPNTHLYVSEQNIAGFPGAAYRIEQVIPFNSREIKQIHRLIQSGSVGVRNFIMTADELKRKLRLKEDSRQRIIGTTVMSGRILVALKPICELN